MTPERGESFVSLFQKLYDGRYTGPLLLHFAQGVPNAYDEPRPPKRIRLDKPEKPRQT